MKKNIRISEPSEEMMEKIRKARHAIANQKTRMVKCPFCGHNSIAVFEDTRGHVQAKCKLCGRETVFDVLSIRSNGGHPPCNEASKCFRNQTG